MSRVFPAPLWDFKLIVLTVVLRIHLPTGVKSYLSDCLAVQDDLIALYVLVQCRQPTGDECLCHELYIWESFPTD